MNMKDALLKAGVEISESKELTEWEKPSDVKFPFGSCVSEKDTPVLSQTVRDALNGINFIRRTMIPTTIEKLRELCPVFEDDVIYKYLIKNIDKVRIISKGGFKRESSYRDGFTGDDCTLQRDTPYGFADVVMYFKYSSISRRILFNFSSSTLNSYYQRDIISKLASFSDRSFFDTYSYENGIKAFKDIRSVVDISPYLLLYVNDYDGCCISHKKYKDDYGLFHEEHTSPCLGVNIKSHKNIMNRLSLWLDNGGYILDNKYYLICEDRYNKEDLYLALWRENNLPNEYSWA